MRSDTAFFFAADIFRRFLAGLTSDLLSATAVAFLERADEERADDADAPRICSTSVNAMISAWRRSISLWRSAIACANMGLANLERTGCTHGSPDPRVCCQLAARTAHPADQQQHRKRDRAGTGRGGTGVRSATIENWSAAALGLPAPSSAAPAAMSTVKVPEASGVIVAV